jgi:hypothetical protein
MDLTDRASEAWKTDQQNKAKFRDFLKGKKTYLLAATTVIGALIGWSQGEINNLTFIGVILAAVQSCFIRAGAATEAVKGAHKAVGEFLLNAPGKPEVDSPTPKTEKAPPWMLSASERREG